MALKALEELKKFIKIDLSGIDKIEKELQGASAFAVSGASEFDKAANSLINPQSADRLVQQIVLRIRQQGKSSVDAHSALDTKLAIDLNIL